MRLQRTQVTWSQLRVGVFALVCFAIILWVALFAGHGLRSVRNRFTVHTILDSTSGLKPGDPVRLAGIEVGTVKKTEFVRQDGTDKVQIQLNLSPKAAQRLRSDSLVQVKSIGFTQGRYVEISLGTPAGEPVEAGVTLTGVVPIEMPVVLDQAMAVSENMNRFLSRSENLVKLLQSGDGTFTKLLVDAALYTNLTQTTSRLSDVANALNTGSGLLPRLLSETEIADNVTESTALAAKWGQQVTEGEGTLGKLSTDPILFDRLERVLETLESVETRLDRIDAVIASTTSVAQKMDSGNGTAARIINSPELHNQIHDTTEKMAQFIDQARAGEGTVGRLVSDPALAQQVAASAASVTELTEKLNTPDNTIDKLATGSDLLDHLLTTTNQLESILVKINDGEGSLSRLTNDRQTAEDLSQLILNLKALATDVQANPKKYVEFNLF